MAANAPEERRMSTAMTIWALFGVVIAVVPIAATEPVHGHGYYLAMRAGDAGVRSMTLTIDHVDGDGEFFAVTRSDRAKASDRFFVEFSDDIPAAAKSVTISGQPDRPVSLRRRVHQPASGRRTDVARRAHGSRRALGP